MILTSTQLQSYKQHFDEIFSAKLMAMLDASSPLTAAIRYATTNGGKRLRPGLVYATGQITGVAPEICDEIACAIEAIHCYSLVHDDLPAMDDDSLRRGRPTCHIAFDEATAILVGDALQALAFEILSQDNLPAINTEQQLALVRCLSHASGAAGMVGGQALDLQFEQLTDVDSTQLDQLHRMKTGALIRTAVHMPCLASPALAANIKENLLTYADAIGLAFQIQDDILDATGEAEKMGKTPGTDDKHNKRTYVSLLGLAQAQKCLHQLHQTAINALDKLECDSHALHEIANFTIHRSH